MLNEVENSTANYITWDGPEDIPFTKTIQNVIVMIISPVVPQTFLRFNIN